MNLLTEKNQPISKDTLIRHYRYAQRNFMPHEVAGALAYSLAHALPLPATKVSSKHATFHATCKDTVHEVLNLLNEAYPLQISEVVGLTKAFWCLRYDMVFPDPSCYCLPVAITKENFPVRYVEALGSLLEFRHEDDKLIDVEIVGMRDLLNSVRGYISGV
jgi:hypothetical protein